MPGTPRAPHDFWLCRGATNDGAFDVRIAKHGVGKSRDGDGKVPVGRYQLGKPRTSQQFGVVIPVGYPTREQRSQGYTGGSIGIHGPQRGMRWLGRFVNMFDTTDGCVGLATDEDVEAVASWIRHSRAATVQIE